MQSTSRVGIVQYSVLNQVSMNLNNSLSKEEEMDFASDSMTKLANETNTHQKDALQ